MKLYQLIYVGLGGMAGSILRYALGTLTVPSSVGTKIVFPWGTFAVNIIGCFVIGILWELSREYEWFSENTRLLLIVGFCGGFTTFSSYILDTINIAKQSIQMATIYILGSILLGLFAVLLGSFLTKSIIS